MLPESRPKKLLMISGGSGITPMLAMLQQLERESYQGDVVMLHYAKNEQDIIARDELQSLHDRCNWFNLLLQLTRSGSSSVARFSEAALLQQVPDAFERHVLLCGPSGLMDSVRQLHESRPFADLNHEHFQLPSLSTESGQGQVHFVNSGRQMSGDKAGNLLELAEQAGLNPESGCRMGICHTCKCRVRSGVVRDLRNNEVRQVQDEDIQLCVHGAAGDVHIHI